MPYPLISKADPEVFAAMTAEDNREQTHLELIASENFVSRAVLEAYTSTLTNKYAEGYPGKRYYGGCGPADQIENIAIERLKKIFGAAYANVQSHSGASANLAAFYAVLQPGDTFLGMDLAHGGHLTHGSAVNFSGLYYKPVAYGVDPDKHLIDYDKAEKLALEHKPKMIIVGASAYPRIIDFARFRSIADKVGAKVMVDMAHIAGLVAAGLHPSPLPYADIVTSTTHKTLRGPRGGIILTNSEEMIKIINSRVFPGVQGGPLMHVIAAKAVAFGEALKPEFKTYQTAVVENAKTLAARLAERGLTLISGGTDNHLMIVNTFDTKGITGKDAQLMLEEANITTNKNMLPYDKNKPAVASGIRLGSPALTTRGFGKNEFIEVADIIADLLDAKGSAEAIAAARTRVAKLCNAFPMTAFRLD
ncbi:MAG: serine hydroxymethyltransferase [Leptospiraceae bacterium]|nr:serine hydroxymethyltransferase [Leptospiraceae bacterium]